MAIGRDFYRVKGDEKVAKVTEVTEAAEGKLAAQRLYSAIS